MPFERKLSRPLTYAALWERDMLVMKEWMDLHHERKLGEGTRGNVRH